MGKGLSGRCSATVTHGLLESVYIILYGLHNLTPVPWSLSQQYILGWCKPSRGRAFAHSIVKGCLLCYLRSKVHIQVAIAIIVNWAQSIVAMKIKKGGKMYSLILNNCVPHFPVYRELWPLWSWGYRIVWATIASWTRVRSWLQKLNKSYTCTYM